MAWRVATWSPRRALVPSPLTDPFSSSFQPPEQPTVLFKAERSFTGNQLPFVGFTYQREQLVKIAAQGPCDAVALGGGLKASPAGANLDLDAQNGLLSFSLYRCLFLPLNAGAVSLASTSSDGATAGGGDANVKVCLSSSRHVRHRMRRLRGCQRIARLSSPQQALHSEIEELKASLQKARQSAADYQAQTLAAEKAKNEAESKLATQSQTTKCAC